MKKTSPKPFVFVLMPFSEEFENVYRAGIKPACQNAGAYAERVDEQIFRESILDRIYNQISKADVVIADMTGRNANVFYETGYAHALGKHVILLTKNEADIPFDLKHYPHIIYGNKIYELLEKLEGRVRWAVENIESIKEDHAAHLNFFIGGSSLKNNPTIEQVNITSGGKFPLTIDVENTDNKYIKTIKFKAGLISSELFRRPQGLENRSRLIKLPKRGYIHLHDREITILPGEWQTIQFYLEASSFDDFLNANRKEDFVLKVYSEEGSYEMPFSVKIKSNYTVDEKTWENVE